MAIEVPEGVQGLFLVLTGERWPTANEDALREVGNAWGTAGDRLDNELAPYMLKTVQTIRSNFTGKSAIKFAEMMAPYVADPPHYIPQAAEQFRELKKFLLNASAQVEYVKIISIEELILLIAQIAWAIAMAFWTDGASMTWLAARMAIVRFLLKTWWGRLILQFILAELFGIAFQLALDVLTQAIQFAKHTRTEWDVQATISAVEVGAVGGLLSIPFSAISHFVSHRLTQALSRALSRDINVTVLQPVVVRAVNEAARNLENTPISKVAKDIANNLMKTADKPLRVRIAEIGLPALIHMAEEGLHEAVTEGTVMAMNGQGFQFNPYSFTSGMAGSIAGQTGHGIGKMLATPKPVREGYTRLGEGDGDSTSLPDSEDSSSDSDSTTLAGDTSESGDSYDDPFDDRHAVMPSPVNRSTTTSSNGTANGTSNSTANGTSHGRSTPPPVPPRNRASDANGSTSVPPVPAKDRASASSTTPSTASRSTSSNGSGTPSRSNGSTPSRSTTGDLTRPSSSSPSSSSSSSPSSSSRGRGGAAEGPSSAGTTSSSTTPSMNQGRSQPSSSSSPREERSASAGGIGTGRSSTGAENEGTAHRSELGSRNPYREASRSSTTTPRGTGPSRSGENEGTANRSESESKNPFREASRSSTATPRGTGPSRSGGPAAESTEAHAGQEGTSRSENPFRRENQTAAAASSRRPAPSAHAELPASVTRDAAIVDASRLATVTAADLSFSGRLVVEGEGTVPAEVAKAAAQRTGVEVVAKVDRAQVGNGRRKGVQWMSFPANGGRPRPVETTPVPVISSAWTPPRLADDVVKRDYPWLPKINPLSVQGGDFLTNCLLAAIGVDHTLEEARLDPTEDPGLLPYYQVPPEAQWPYEHLANMGKGDPVDVPGYQAIVDAVRAAGRGARGMVLVGTRGTDVDHVFNVVFAGNEIVFLDGQKGTQANLPASFRSLQFLPTSEGFPRETISVRPTPWQHGAFIGAEPQNGTAGNVRPEARRPFPGKGRRVGRTDGKGAAIPGVDNAAREQAAARRADAKAKAEGKDPRGGWRPTTPRRGSPVTIADVSRENTSREAAQRAEPFAGEGRPLGRGEDARGIPGMDEKARQEAEARRAAAQDDASRNGEPSAAKSRLQPGGRGGARYAVTIQDVLRELNPFPGTGHTLGEGDGKGTGIPGLSNEDREKSEAERLKRADNPVEGTEKATITPFSGTGRTLGDSNGTSLGIPGLTEEEHQEAADRRAKAQEEQEETAVPAGGRRSGKGFDGDPVTFADLPEDRPQQQKPVPFSGTGEVLGARSGEDTETTELPGSEQRKAKWEETRGTREESDSDWETETPPERFPGKGRKVGRGDGRGAGIPGLDKTKRDHARAERAKRTGKRSKRRVYKPPAKPVTLSDLTDSEAEGTGRSSGGRFQQQRSAGTTTLLETQPQPAERPGPASPSAENVQEVAKAHRKENTRKAPAEPSTDESATTTGRSGADRGANGREEPPAYTASSNGRRRSSAAEPASRSSSPPPPYSASGTAAEVKQPGDDEVTEARATLAALDAPRREDLMNEAGAIVGDVSGLVPAKADPGAHATPVDRAMLRVAAELANSGREGAERLARELVRGLTEQQESKAPPKRVPRVTVDNDRVELARSTFGLLHKISEKQTIEVLSEAKVMVENLAGQKLSLTPGRGQAQQLTMVWLLAAAEIPWAGHQAAEDLAADILGVPRSKPGSPSQWVRGFANAAKNHPGRARVTLGLMSDQRSDGFLTQADAILRETQPLSKGDERARRRDQLMIAAELSRSGPDAGHALAQELAAHAAVAERRAAAPAKKKVAWADDDAPQIETKAEKTEKKVRFTVEDETDESELEDEEWGDEDGEHPEHAEDELGLNTAHEDEEEDTGETHDENEGPKPAPPYASGDTSSTAAEHMPIEKVFAETRVGVVDGRTVAIWLPGASEDGPKFDVKTLEQLGEVVPDGVVAVIGTVKDGKVLAGGREISVDTLAAIIAGRAQDKRPFLLMSGGGAVAEPLSSALNEPVLASPYETVFDPSSGSVASRRSDGVESGEKDDARSTWFRLYVPGDSKGTPVIEGLHGTPKNVSEGQNGKDEKTGKDGGEKDEHEKDDEDGTRREKPSGRPGFEPEPHHFAFADLKPQRGPEKKKDPDPPEPGDPRTLALEPILADPMARAIGVPRAGLPQMPQLIEEIRTQLAALRATYSENDMNLLAHRLLANYPYLLGSGKDEGTDGLMVQIGDAELLITLNPDDPHQLTNPGGSTLAPSELPPVEKQHHAVDTINATYATGAHVQTQSGQTGATRGAISFSFGIGATPGILQVVRLNASISGTANQSNRSTTHIADAEGGHVEDNRTDANLVSYTPNWSFKVRRNPNARWEKRPVHKLKPPVDSKKEEGEKPTHDLMADVFEMKELVKKEDREAGREKLLLWIPQHYLRLPPSEQVTATGKEVKSKRLPAFYVASGLTNIPKLFDEIAGVLAGQGLALPLGSMIRQELLHKLWNLNAHLDDAVNLDRGYRITLHNKYGRPVARVKVRSERLQERVRRVGTTSNKAHIENVRTAIDGTSGGHTVTNTSSITPLSAEFDLLPNPTGIPDLDLGISAALTYTSTNAEGISTGRVGLNVLVPRNTSYTAAYSVNFDHAATVSVRGRRRPNVKTKTKPVRGGALLRMPEAAAYDHGFSVDRAALKDQKGLTSEKDRKDVKAQEGQKDRKEYKGQQGSDIRHAWQKDAIRGTGPRVGDETVKRQPPSYVVDGKGVGMGLVMVDEGTVTTLEKMIKNRLRAEGFLPANEDDPFAGYTRLGHGNRTDSLIDNLELVDKMVSHRGLESHYDQIHQDGMTFTLRKRSGGAKMDLDIDSARVTIKARANKKKPPRFIRTTDEYHTVNLAMGMDSAGMSVAHSRKVAFGVKLKGLFKDLKGMSMGLEWQRTVGASDSVNMLNNRPELLEYPGVVDEYELTSDYDVTIEFQHSGVLRPGIRHAPRIEVKDQIAKTYLLPSGNETGGPESTRRTPARVLDQGVVYFLDTTGTRERAGRALRDMTGPAGTADLDVSSFSSTIEMRSHLKEILAGQYTTDRPFKPGLFRDTFGGMDIRGRMGTSRFTGATPDKFVLGVIKLWLTEGKLTDSSSSGKTWDQLDTAVGGPVGEASMTGEVDVNRHWQYNRSKSSGRAGGKEHIQLDFNHVYFYDTEVELTVSGRQEMHSKLWLSGTPEHTNPTMRPRRMVYILPEPDALTHYADEILPVSDVQLADAMTRWRKGELRLSGDVAAKILTVWQKQSPTLPSGLKVDREELAATLVKRHESGATFIRNDKARDGFNRAYKRQLRPPYDPYAIPEMPKDLVAYVGGGKALTDERLAEAMRAWESGRLSLSGDVVASVLLRWKHDRPDQDGLGIDRDRLVKRLVELHEAGGLPIRTKAIRDRFNDVYWTYAVNGAPVPFEHMEMPEYLTREDPNGRFLGHVGVNDLSFKNGRTTYDLVRQHVERVAPGMLAQGAELWAGDGRRIGKMQGTVDALQSIFARGRDQAMWEDVLAKGGYSIYLVHPVGWLLSDVVEINLSGVLTSSPRVQDFKPNTGLENYGHAYVGTSRSKSRDASQAVVGKLSAGGARAGGDGNLRAGVGDHGSTTEAHNAVKEQTVYDWSGHYRVEFDQQLEVTARRLRSPGRPLNNLLMEGFKRWTRAGAESSDTYGGKLNLQVPRALAEAGQIRGPKPLRDMLPLPKLPNNAYVTGTTLTLLPEGKSLLGRLFGPRWYEKALGARAGDPKTRSSLSLPVLLSRTHVTNHLRDAIGGDKYKLADDLFIPGDSTSRATIWLGGDLHDMQVIGRMKEGTGTGRYIKHQSGTTASTTTDLNRVTPGYDVSGTSNMEDHRPKDPQNTWNFGDSGTRTTSANQASAGTENYRREQHAKEQGATLLLRMRGQFWLEAQKTSHHLFRKATNSGGIVRSDPVTGDVYVEMFEAQYEELRKQMADKRRDAQTKLQKRVTPAAWQGLEYAEPIDTTALLAEAAENGVDAHHALDYVVRRIREERGGNRPLVLDFERTERERLNRVAQWAVENMTADLKEQRKTDPTMAEPGSLSDYRSYSANLDAGILPTGMNESDIDDEITEIIVDVNSFHRDSPIAQRERFMPLPEAPVLSLDPVFLTRDIAHELNAHVLMRRRRLDGTWQERWADPSGRIHAFDPATFTSMLVADDEAVRVGLMTTELHNEVLLYGLTNADLGSAYHHSWEEQQTFEQMVRAEIARRRAHLAEVHQALPSLFDRTATAVAAWAESAMYWEVEVKGRKAALDELGPPTDAAAQAQDGEAEEGRRKDRQERHTRYDEASRKLKAADGSVKNAIALLDGLQVAMRGSAQAAQTVWTDESVQMVGQNLSTLEPEVRGRRLRLGFRNWTGPTANAAFEAIEKRLRGAGEGALSYIQHTVPNEDGSSTTNVFKAVYYNGRVQWFGGAADTPVSSPVANPQAGRVQSFDVGPTGRLLEPDPAHWRNAAIEFKEQREFWLSQVSKNLDTGESAPLPSVSPALSRSGSLAESGMMLYALMSGDGSPAASPPISRPQTPHGGGLMMRPRHIVDLAVAAAGRMPARPHVFMHSGGRSGIGPAGRVEALWRQVGDLADYAPILWLTEGRHEMPLTADGFTIEGLHDAVDFFRDADTTRQVERVFTGQGRITETKGQLPTGLPEGTWIWYTGPTGTGAMVVTTGGRFLVYAADEKKITPRPEHEVRSAFAKDPHRFVIAQPPVSSHTEKRGKPGGALPAELTTKQKDTPKLPVAAKTPKDDVDFPMPNDPQLFINDNGHYWVAAPGTAGEWHHLGSFAEYAPISWLLSNATEQRVTAMDAVHNDRGRAIRFLDAAARAQNRTEAIRSFLANNATDRRVEVLRRLPENLPSGTWIYVADENGRSAAAVVLPDGRIRRHVNGQVQTSVSPMTAGMTGTFVVAQPKVSARPKDFSRPKDFTQTTGRKRSASVPRSMQVPKFTLSDFMIPGRRRGGSVSGQQPPDTKTPSGTTTPKGLGLGGFDETGLDKKGLDKKGLGQKGTDDSPLSETAQGKQYADPFKDYDLDEAIALALQQEWLLDNPRVLGDTLGRLGLTAVDVPGDNNCFYHALLVVAGSYIEQHVNGVDLSRRDRVGIRANIQALRSWLAGRLRADFHVANQGLPSRYGEFFHLDESLPINPQQDELLRQIRDMDSWNNEAGDRVAEIAARELGLPMTLVQGEYIYDIGPAGAERIHFIRTPNHYQGARRNDQAPAMSPSALGQLRQPAPSGPADGRRTLAAGRTEQLRRLRTANDLLNQVLQTVGSQLAAGVVDAYRQRSVDQTAAFNLADQAAYRDEPAYLRAGRRIGDMRRAAATVEETVIALALEYPQLLTLVPGILQIRRLVEVVFPQFVARYPDLLQQYPQILQLQPEILVHHPDLGGGPSAAGPS